MRKRNKGKPQKNWAKSNQIDQWMSDKIKFIYFFQRFFSLFDSGCFLIFFLLFSIWVSLDYTCYFLIEQFLIQWVNYIFYRFFLTFGIFLTHFRCFDFRQDHTDRNKLNYSNLIKSNWWKKTTYVCLLCYNYSIRR